MELKGERTLIITLQADGHSTPHYVVSVPPFSSSARDLRALTFLTWQIRSPVAAVKRWGLCLTFSGAVMSWRAVPIKALQGVKRSDRQGNADHNASFKSRPWKQGKMTQEFWSYSLAKCLSSSSHFYQDVGDNLFPKSFQYRNWKPKWSHLYHFLDISSSVYFK